MDHVAYGILLFLGVGAFSILLTKILIRIAPLMGLLDHPGERRIHTEVKPRGGGIGICMAYFLGSYIWIWHVLEPEILGKEWFYWFALGSLVLLAVGILDDRFGISPFIKLVGQLLAAGILFYGRKEGIGRILGWEVPLALDMLVFVVWVVGLVNAFNLIDGMDGLCGGLAVISITALVVLSFSHGLVGDGFVMLMMVGALLGFLRYNVHPAKIFLGDTGAMFIGLFIASAASGAVGERAVVTALLLPLLVAGVPLFDVLLAVWRRTGRRWGGFLLGRKGVKVFGADREHLHHRLLDAGLSQHRVAMIMYGLAMGGVVVALIPSFMGVEAAGVTLAAVLIAFLSGARYLIQVEIKASGEVLDMVLKRPVGGRLIAVGYYVYDCVVLLSAQLIALVLDSNGFTLKVDWPHVSVMMAITTASGMIGLRLAKAQVRHWGRADHRDYWALAIWFFIAILVGFTLHLLFVVDVAWASARFHIMTYLFALVGLYIPRSMVVLLREARIDSHHRRARSNRGGIILYGAGGLGELFLHYLKRTDREMLHATQILGFVDDNRHLRGRWMDGFRIFGGGGQLPFLVNKYGVEKVVVTMRDIPEGFVEELERICAGLGVKVQVWQPSFDFKEPSHSERQS